MSQATCKTCGQQFKFNGPGSLYCSPGCHPVCRFEGCGRWAQSLGLCVAHWNQQRRGVHLRPIKPWTTAMVCIVCGSPSGLKTDLRRFCSHSCESKWHRYKGDVPKSAICTVCGDEIIYGPVPGRRSVPVGTTKCPGKCRRSTRYLRVKIAALVERDGLECRLCGGSLDLALKWPHRMFVTRDHIVPPSAGGTETIENLQLAHLSCNVRKGNKITGAKVNPMRRTAFAPVSGTHPSRSLARMYEVPESKASIKQNQFEFRLAGKTYSVPLLQYLTGEQVEKLAAMERLEGMEQVSAQFDLFGSKDSPIGKAVRKLDAQQLGELTQAWAEASTISVGESSASGSSSNGTRGPSSTTSSPSASDSETAPALA